MYMSHIYAKEEEHTETDQRSIEKERRTQPSEQQRSRQSIRGSRQSYWEPIGSHLSMGHSNHSYLRNSAKGILYRRSRASKGAIGSRIHIDISSYVIGLVKPMYACFNIIGD